MKRFFTGTPRVLAACFFALSAISLPARAAPLPSASTRDFPVLARRENIAPPNAKTLALPPGNVAVAKNATRELRLDLDGDGTIETVRIDARRDPMIAIYRGGKLVAKGAPRSWRAWKMTTGDVDGDGFREIFLGVNKATNSLPFLHNCLFVLGFDGKRIYRKWLFAGALKIACDGAPLHGFAPAAFGGLQNLASGTFFLFQPRVARGFVPRLAALLSSLLRPKGGDMNG